MFFIELIKNAQYIENTVRLLLKLEKLELSINLVLVKRIELLQQSYTILSRTRLPVPPHEQFSFIIPHNIFFE